MSTRIRPHCLACGSARIEFTYTSDMDGSEINETHTLRGAAWYLSEYASENIGSGENSGAWAVGIADVLTRICAMWKVREDREKEEKAGSVAEQSGPT